MTPLPNLRPQEVVSILKRIGYQVDHQTGSHMILYKEGRLPISVPMHHRDMKKGTLQQIIRSTSLNIDEFLSYR